MKRARKAGCLFQALGVSMLTVSGAEAGAPDLPAPPGYQISDFESVCNIAHGFRTFHAEVDCIKSLIDRSPNPHHRAGDPQTRLYILTADKLVEDVEKKRITPAAARLELHQVYLQILAANTAGREQAAAVERQRQEIERSEANQRAEQERANRASAAEAEAAQARYRSTVNACIAQAGARRATFKNLRFGAVGNSVADGMRAADIANGGGQDPEMCSRDPNWYMTIPVQANTVCNDSGFGLTCTTR